MVDAQTQFNAKYDSTTFTGKTINDDGSAKTSGNGAGDKWSGRLEIKDFTTLEEIDISSNDLEEVVFINCPNLKNINVTSNKIRILEIDKLAIDSNGRPDKNKLDSLKCGKNEIVKIDFTYCEVLRFFDCPNNPKLDRIENIDRVWGIERINMKGSGPVRVMHATKENIFRGVVNEVKDLFGVEHAGQLPLEDWTNPKTGKTEKRINKLALKKDLMDNVALVKTPQLKTEKEQAEKKSLTAEGKLNSTETERDQLKQQLENIRKELSLAKDATEKQFLDKIKELKDKPSGPACTHTDYDTIKSKRDSLQTELESKKRKISELENSNKENKNDDMITKKRLVSSTNTNLASWGVNISSEHKEKMQDAISAERVEEVRNEIIKMELDKLKDENKGSFYLNLGLGALTVGSLIILAWMMMRQTNLPKMEPERKGEK